MSKYSQLRNYCKANKIKVKEVGSKVLHDFGGMNDEAAKKFGFRKMKDKSILLDRYAKSDRKYRDLKHELVEMRLMETKRMPYWSAHKRALKSESKPYKPKGRY
ncbi:MAG: hypothetical protein WC516_09740 [Patescibacteria group bacterium]|jgi:hypothetical protein